jgi:hypothetical protein
MGSIEVYLKDGTCWRGECQNGWQNVVTKERIDDNELEARMRREKTSPKLKYVRVLRSHLR